MDIPEQLQAAWGLIGYLLAVAVMLAWQPTRLISRAAVAVFAFGLVTGAFWQVRSLGIDISFSRATFLLAMALGGALTLAAMVTERWGPWTTVAPLGAAAGLVWLGHVTHASEDFTLDSHYYVLSVGVDRPSVLASETATEGGGLARVGDTLLLVTGRGRFAQLERADGRLRAIPLAIPDPANHEAFEREAGEGIFTSQFRVIDMLAEHRDSRIVVLVSHHVWHGDRRCYALRVSETDGSMGLDDWTPWRVRYESEPCLPIDASRRGVRFDGAAAGGRMARVPEGILLTVGDHLFDGLNAPEAYPQDSAADYGKTILLLPDGKHRVFTSGHRNPQGLAVDTAGGIWSSEHGPRGGDEINLLRDGGNYGWPWRVLGTEYGIRRWPLLRPPAPQWEEPVFAFVPSVGPSSLLTATSSLLPDWKGDLLLGTLRNRELLRLRLDADRVTYVEELPLGHEVRDLEFDATGSLVIWTDDAALLTIRPDASDRTAEALAAQCADCHTLNPGQRGGLAPNLYGVVGRGVARTAFPYSDALRALGGRWTPERLDAFLADPARYAPGTSMSFPGIADPTQRSVLIDYLREGRR